MKRAIMRPAFLSLALLGALALASRAQDESPAEAAAPDAAARRDRAAQRDGAARRDGPATRDEAPPRDDAAGPRDFSGKYLASGVSNTGKGYKAMVEITRDQDVYQVIWVLGPREGYMGVGVVEGDALCVGWAIGEVPGVVIYKPDADAKEKKLVGRWTAPGSQGKTFTETLARLP